MSAPVDGKVILHFRNGELVGIMPDASMTDEQAAALLKQVERAAACGDLTGIRADDAR